MRYVWDTGQEPGFGAVTVLLLQKKTASTHILLNREKKRV